MEEANGRLMWIVPISIGLILSLLYTAFNSIKDALLVMVNVVEASMGGILALWLTGTPFSISAAVGFVSVFGVAVQDGVLLISYFNQLRAAGLPVRESVMRGAELRVRPVVMTSLTAALGSASGRHGDLDRLAGPEAAGDRGRRRDALHPVPDPLPDAGALQLLPGSRRPRRVQERPDPGLALYRPVPPPDSSIRPCRPSPRSRRQRRPIVHRSQWLRRVISHEDSTGKCWLAVVVIAAGATGLALNSWTRGQVVGVLKQLSQAAAHGEESPPDKSWIAESAAKSKAPWDRILTLDAEPDRGNRPEDGRCQAADRADGL